MDTALGWRDGDAQWRPLGDVLAEIAKEAPAIGAAISNASVVEGGPLKRPTKWQVILLLVGCLALLVVLGNAPATASKDLQPAYALTSVFRSSRFYTPHTSLLTLLLIIVSLATWLGYNLLRPFAGARRSIDNPLFSLFHSFNNDTVPPSVPSHDTDSRIESLQEAAATNRIDAADAYEQAMIERYGCDAECLPNAHGDFGLAATNPILSQGALRGLLYVSRLWYDEHTPAKAVRIGSVSSAVHPLPVDVYELRDLQNQRPLNVYVSVYHKRTSTKAPQGLVLKTLSHLQ